MKTKRAENEEIQIRECGEKSEIESDKDEGKKGNQCEEKKVKLESNFKIGLFILIHGGR